MTNIHYEYITGPEARDLRKSIGLNQSEFWGRLGVTQVTGSRYESGCNSIPRSVRLCLAIAYGLTPLQVVARLRGEK